MPINKFRSMRSAFVRFVIVFILVMPGMKAVYGQQPAAPMTVKVAVVMQDPRIPGMGNKRLHELFKTPGYSFAWHDPWKLMEDYRDSLNSMSHGAVRYEVVRIYDESIFFTRLKNERSVLTLDRVKELLSEPGWATLKKEGTTFEYKDFIEHYGFGQMRDRKEIQEVWVWSFPYGGAYESTFAGKDAFWLNSDPVQGVSNKDLLIVMGLNYEREMSMALESYGHRVESIMRKVYGRWNNQAVVPNNWELYTMIDKTAPGGAMVGNIHYPPNGRSDYDWKNSSQVPCYGDVWYRYPRIDTEGVRPRIVDCRDWQCSHVGYMSWWFRHLPHFAGINGADGHLNNWWYYATDYNAAMKEERRLAAVGKAREEGARRGAAEGATGAGRETGAGQGKEPLIDLHAGMVIRRSGVVRSGVYKLAAAAGMQEAPIVIEGNDITVDFNGAVIDGGSNPSEPDAFRGVGILIRGGRNITLKNFTVRGYKVGLMGREVMGLRIEHGDLSWNFRQRLGSTREREDLADWQSYHHNEQDEWLRFGAGIYLYGCDSCDVHDCTVTGGQCGLMLTRCHDCQVYNNNFSYNSGVGIGLYRSSGNRIFYNRVDWNVRGFSYGVYYRGQDSGGILVFEQSSHNEIACNSVTHSGDGLFLWAGETTQETGEGGCNDNLVYGNDFSYAPTNAVEITFSRNRIIRNILHDSWHGIWGGFSHHTLIAGNDIANNLSGIAIEHGNNDTIAGNFFRNNGVSLELWANDGRPKDNGFLRNRDTHSRDYYIHANSFTDEKRPFSVQHTTHLTIEDNQLPGAEPRFDSSVRELVYRRNDEAQAGAAGMAVMRFHPVLPPGVRPKDPMMGADHPQGKEYIMMTEWGPYDFRRPILWKKGQDSAGVLTLAIMGPKGTWRLRRMQGVTAPSMVAGSVPGVLTVHVARPGKYDSSLKDIDIALEYTGESVVSPFGIRTAAGKPYVFHYREFKADRWWRMKWYAFDEASDPVQHEEKFARLLEGAPVKTTEGGELADVFGTGFGKHIATKKVATVSETVVDVPAGAYLLGISASEIVRVYVDGRRVIDGWDPAKLVNDADYHREAVVRLRGRHVIRVEQAQYGDYGMLFFSLQPYGAGGVRAGG